MAILIEDNIVWLQVSEDDISLMKVLQSQEHLSQIHPSSILCKSFVFLKCTAHVATRGVIEKKKELLGRLKGVLQSDYERMSGVSEYIALSFCILDQVLTKDLLFVQNFHSEVFASLLRLSARIVGVEP